MKQTKGPTKHQLRSEATRSALLQAAEKIFARDGYESAQIDEIARESGRTRGAVYAQYKTKERLFFAVQQQRIEESAREINAILSKIDEKDYIGRLNALRGYYTGLRDATNSILDLEMKLFALRHADSVESWRENYLEMFPSSEFGRQFGLRDEAGLATVDNRVIALAAVKGGIVLAMNFLPDKLTAKETEFLLGQLFDGLFPAVRNEGEPSELKRDRKGPRRPKTQS